MEIREYDKLEVDPIHPLMLLQVSPYTAIFKKIGTTCRQICKNKLNKQNRLSDGLRERLLYIVKP